MRSFSRLSLLSFFCWTVVSAGTTLAPAPAVAQEAALSKARDLNKKAVEAYENLDPDEARKFLQQALEVFAADGLDKHPLKATTHVTMGVVLVGGLKQRDAGIRQFKRALEIQADARIPKRLSTPEVVAAFEEARKDAGTAATPTPEPAKAEPAKPDPAKPAAVVGDGPPSDIKGIYHEPLTEAKTGAALNIKAAVQKGLAFEKLVLAYRPEGATDFLARDMDKDDKGWYTARIPEPALAGANVSYYIEARGAKGQSVASNGTSGEPHQVALSAPSAPKPVAQESSEDGPGGDGAVAKEKPSGAPGNYAGGRIFVILGAGVGGGITDGTAELNPEYGVDRKPNTYKGAAPANAGHIVGEVGYLLAPRLLLSVQARYQVITGATEWRDPSCPSGVCPAAKEALAAFAKATYFLGDSATFRPFVGGGLGLGDIRHLVNISNRLGLDGKKKLTDCGRTRDQPCIDTVAMGGLFVVASVGFVYNVSDGFMLTLSLNPEVAMPKVLLNVDLNFGLGLRF